MLGWQLLNNVHWTRRSRSEERMDGLSAVDWSRAMRSELSGEAMRRGLSVRLARVVDIVSPQEAGKWRDKWSEWALALLLEGLWFEKTGAENFESAELMLMFSERRSEEGKVCRAVGLIVGLGSESLEGIVGMRSSLEGIVSRLEVRLDWLREDFRALREIEWLILSEVSSFGSDTTTRP